MAVDMFLKIEGIKGESSDDKHKGEIDVLSWSWGVSQTGSMHSGTGGGAGKANVQDVTVTKYVDSASPLLIEACLTGRHVKEVLLTVRKAGGKPLEYIKLKLMDAMVTGVSNSGSQGEERLTENLVLNFAKVGITYTPQKADGSGDAPKEYGWDIRSGKAL